MFVPSVVPADTCVHDPWNFVVNEGLHTNSKIGATIAFSKLVKRAQIAFTLRVREAFYDVLVMFFQVEAGSITTNPRLHWSILPLGINNPCHRPLSPFLGKIWRSAQTHSAAHCLNSKHVNITFHSKFTWTNAFYPQFSLILHNDQKIDLLGGILDFSTYKMAPWHFVYTKIQDAMIAFCKYGKSRCRAAGYFIAGRHPGMPWHPYDYQQ